MIWCNYTRQNPNAYLCNEETIIMYKEINLEMSPKG